MAAVAHHGDGVGDAENLIHLVGDVDDGHAALLSSPPITRNNAVTSRSESAVVGSSMMITEASWASALTISTVCISATLRSPILRAGSIGDAESCQQGLRLAVHRGTIDPAGKPAARFAADGDVFRDAEIAEGHQFLMDHRDAPAERVVRTAQAQRFAAEQDLPGIRRVQSGEDFHQRGLAGTVFAHDDVDLAGLDVELRVHQGPHSGEGFG